jgi:hypothetical protein
MVKMNSPVSSFNGEQAFWINGEKKNHLGPGFPNGLWVDCGFYQGGTTPFPGYQWRTTTALNINYVFLEHYVDADPACSAWYDDVVVAKSYIGPMVSGPSANPHASSPARLSSLNVVWSLFGAGPYFDIVLEQSGDFTLKVLDVAGKEIWRCFQANASAGKHSILFNAAAEEQPAGLYSVVFAHNGQQVSRKFMIMK